MKLPSIHHVVAQDLRGGAAIPRVASGLILHMSKPVRPQYGDSLPYFAAEVKLSEVVLRPERTERIGLVHFIRLDNLV